MLRLVQTGCKLRAGGISADWSDGEGTCETLSEQPESEVLYCYATSAPRVVGALVMGIKGDRWPRRRCACPAARTVAAATS